MKSINKKTPSALLAAIHGTARDLYKHGFIDQRSMHEYDALCLKPIADYSSAQIRAMRRDLNISQAVLAAVLNTSVSTVRSWEQGDKRPSGP